MAVRSLRVPPRSLSSIEQTDRPLRPLAQARARREHLPYYLDLHPAMRFLLAVVLVCVVSLLYLMQTSRVATENYKLQAAETRHAELMRENQSLQLTIANLRSLKRIEDIAKHKLGMVPIGDQFIYLHIDPNDRPAAAQPPNGSPPQAAIP